VIGPFWAKWGLERVLRSPIFLCGNPEDGNFATADFHQIWSRNVVRCPVTESGKTVSKIHFRGHLPPKSEIENRSNRHLTQSRLQVMGCTAAERYGLLHVVVQGPGSFRGRSTFLYNVRLRNYGASKLSNFWILAYFSYTQPEKRTFR